MVPQSFYDKLAAVKDQFEWKIIKTESYTGNSLHKIRGLQGTDKNCPLQAVYGKYYVTEGEKDMGKLATNQVIAAADYYSDHPEFNEEIRQKLLETVGLSQ